MQERKFLCCAHCGNLVGMIHNAGGEITCCGEQMKSPHMVAITDGCQVKERENIAVVDTNFPRGEIPQWIYLQTNIGGQRKKTEGFPSVSFRLDEQEVAQGIYCYFADHHMGMLEC